MNTQQFCFNRKGKRKNTAVFQNILEMTRSKRQDKIREMYTSDEEDCPVLLPSALCAPYTRRKAAAARQKTPYRTGDGAKELPQQLADISLTSPAVAAADAIPSSSPPPVAATVRDKGNEFVIPVNENPIERCEEEDHEV